MNKRAFLAIILSFLVVMAYQYLFVRPNQQQAQKPEAQKAEAQKPEAKTEPRAPAATRPSAPAPAADKPAARPVAPVARGAEKDVRVESPLYTAVVSTKGASLQSFALKQFHKTQAPDSGLIEMVNQLEGAEKPLSITFPDSSFDVSPLEVYQTDSTSLDLTRGTEPRKLTMSLSYPGGIKILKIFTFYPDRYSFDLDVQVVNASSAVLGQKPLLGWHEYVDPKGEEDSYGHQGPIYLVKGSVDTENGKKADPMKYLGPDVSWGAFESKYFIAAMIPKQPSLTGLLITKDQRNVVSVSLDGPKNMIPANQTGAFSYTVYIGPKDYDILKAQGVGLEDSIDYGSWIKWLALPLLVFLKFLNNFVHNYGVAIIILTAIIKIIFWPLGNKSYRSMKQMQKLQPQMNALRERYKNDKARLNQEVMQLYKTHKVNPLGGCVPMLIQIPVFFGLYKVLLYSIALRHAPFVFWIQDLSAKDPYYITPIVMGASMFWQQTMTPQMGDSMQQKLMLLMPVIFTFLFLNFPSGLVIYWLFNNIFSIGQQYYIEKKAA